MKQRSRVLFFVVVLIAFIVTPVSSYAANTLIFNDRLAIQVASDGRFNMGAFPTASGDAQTGSWNTIYYWPNDPGTSFSTVVVDGVATKFNTTTQVSAPQNVTATANETVRRFNDIEITQRLEIVANASTGQNDLARISYTYRNTGTVAHSVALRILIDTMVNNNDGALFRLPGDASRVINERDVIPPPQSMQVFKSLDDTEHVVVASFSGGDATPPDALTLANWRNIYNNTDPYQYTPQTSSPIGDSAYALYWNPKLLNAGERREFVTYYGLSTLTAGSAPPLLIGLTGPALLQVKDHAYTPNPFVVTVTLKNTNASTTATNVQATLTLPPGLVLVSGPTPSAIGDIAPGEEKQITWQVQAQTQTVQTTLTYGVQVSGDNIQSGSVSAQIIIPGITPLIPPPAPAATTSRYMRDIDPKVVEQYGCNAGKANMSGVVVLLFGQPTYDGLPEQLGTLLPGSKTFITLQQIQLASEAWARGFYNCTSSNTTSVKLAIGTSNDQIDVDIVLGSRSRAAGEAWAQMINTVAANTQMYRRQVSIVGANNIELDWAPASNTKEWVDGYTSLTNYAYYNVGACEGCPTKTSPLGDETRKFGKGPKGWVFGDIWYVSWGNKAAQAMPQIYDAAGVQAASWQYLAYWSQLRKGSRMILAGASSQHQSCLDRRDGNGNYPKDCTGLDLQINTADDLNNTADVAWQQLWLALNADDTTRQTPLYATDITWQK